MKTPRRKLLRYIADLRTWNGGVCRYCGTRLVKDGVIWKCCECKAFVPLITTFNPEIGDGYREGL